METTITKLAKFVADARFTDLPADAVNTMRWLLLDTFGCAVAGVKSDKGRWGHEYVKQFFSGPQQARALGYPEKFSLFGAAFLNGELINGLDYEASNMHLPPLVIPPAIAAAEKNHASGKDFILACAMALEIGIRIGKEDFRNIKKDGKTGLPPVTGYSSAVFGGAAGVAKLEGLDADQMAQALSLTGLMSPINSQTPMHRNVPTTSAKYLMAGWASQTGLSGVYLTMAGHRGDLQVLDGEFGYWRMVGKDSWDPDAVLANLGGDWRFAKMIPFKQYPCCRIMHGGLDCLGKVMADNGISPEEIESIHLYVEPTCVEPVFNNTVIENQIDTQFCIPYNVAVKAYGIKPGVDWQTPETMHDPRIRELMKKVTFEPHPDYVEALRKDPLSRMSGAEVRARGKVFREDSMYIKGTAGTDTCLSEEELYNKFIDNVSSVLPVENAKAAADKLMKLDEVADINEIMDLLCV